MLIKKITVNNFKSISSSTIEFNDLIYVLAGQNESGKSTIIEALDTFEKEIVNRENLNFEEESNGKTKQSISVTYLTNENLLKKVEQNCSTLIDENSRNTIPNFTLFDFDKLNKIKEFTITKSIDYDKEESFTTEINEQALQLLKLAIKRLPKDEDNLVTTLAKLLLPVIDFDSKKNEIIKKIWLSCPDIVTFDSITDILPDEVLINDLKIRNNRIKGINAVRNFEKILEIDFVKISEKSAPLKKGLIETKNKNLTASFQKDWKQKIAGNRQVEISFEMLFDQNGSEKIQFYVKSKDGVYLQPRRRSKGLIWFLSLWLELKASESEKGIVFLFDEPGQNLHVKAHQDLLLVFKNLSKFGHQIIYTTHSPSLIELDKLHNIGLVLNTENEGSVVEGLTSSKLDSPFKKDALQPIADAMGLNPLNDFSILSRRNIILEGLSDFWYFQGMKKILGYKGDYKFVPSIGIKSSKIYPLISFCIGYGLEWILLMDNGINPNNTKNELSESIFSNDEVETNNHIKLLKFQEIEDMFSHEDLGLFTTILKPSKSKKVSELIGNRKIIVAKQFFNEIESGNLTKNKLSNQTIENFEEVFEIIHKTFNS